MSESPYIKIWALDSSCEYPVVEQARVKREYLDNTLNSHGYHCQPMTTANLHGWDFILPQDVEVTWDGISDTESSHVTILNGRLLPSGAALVDTGTANATLSFNLNAFVETDKDHYILLDGPSNYFVDGAKPMSALIRSDWYNFNSLQFCWKLTTPNKVVTFKKGTPFMRLVNYPIGLLESTTVSVSSATEEQISKTSLYNNDRQAFYSKYPGKWPHLYKKGLEGVGEESSRHLDSAYRPVPTKPILE